MFGWRRAAIAVRLASCDTDQARGGARAMLDELM
jgi:hypothetical protein